MLRNGDGAYPSCWPRSTRRRRRSGLASYIFRDDEAGLPFIDALIRAHRRGVQVRVLIDGIGGGYFRSGTYEPPARGRACRSTGSCIPTCRGRRRSSTCANHRKLLVVDGRIAFTGGINIGPREPAAGQSAPSGARHPFPHRRPGGRAAHRGCSPTTGSTRPGRSCWTTPGSRRLEPVGTAAARVDHLGPDEDIEQIEFAILHAISCARRSIRVVTPYFLPPDC
jgi:cardiolipin synthase